jgi:hypothetical protein
MKNLLIYISPTGSFDNPRSDLASNDVPTLVKVQIENSLELGWKKEDILLVTNFEYKYGDIEALVLKDVEFFDRKPQASKINAIIKMFEHGLIEEKELYWFHDFDAFQLEKISEVEINLKDDQIGLTDYGGGKYFGGIDRWSTGVIFFRSGAKDIFDGLKEIYYQKKIDEEEALHLLIDKESNLKKRVIKVNNTYNFIGYKLESVYKKSIQPLKVVHFHPLTGKRRLGGIGSESALRFFKGENPLQTPLLTDRLIRILKYHRIG